MSADFEFKEEEEEEKAMRREALRPRRACCRDLAIDGDDMASRGVIDIGEDEASQVRVGGGFSFLTAPLIEVITPSMAVVSAAHQSPPDRSLYNLESRAATTMAMVRKANPKHSHNFTCGLGGVE